MTNESGPEAALSSPRNDCPNCMPRDVRGWSFLELLHELRYADLTVDQVYGLQVALAERCGAEMSRAFQDKWQGKVMFTIPEVAEFVGVAIPTIRSWIRKGILPARKFGTTMNAAVRIHRNDLEPERSRGRY